MARKTIYCARAFWKTQSGLEGGRVHQFLTPERAMEGGAILAKSADGVAVFSLTGEPDTDYWDEPKIIERLGDAPRGDALDQSWAA